MRRLRGARYRDVRLRLRRRLRRISTAPPRGDRRGLRPLCRQGPVIGTRTGAASGRTRCIDRAAAQAGTVGALTGRSCAGPRCRCRIPSVAVISCGWTRGIHIPSLHLIETVSGCVLRILVRSISLRRWDGPVIGTHSISRIRCHRFISASRFTRRRRGNPRVRDGRKPFAPSRTDTWIGADHYRQRAVSRGPHGGPVRGSPEAYRSRLHIQAVSHQRTLPPRLLDIPASCRDPPVRKDPVSEMVQIDCSKRAVHLTIEEIARGSRVQRAQTRQVMVMASAIKKVMVDVIKIAWPQRTPGNPAGPAIEGNESGRPETERERRSGNPGPSKARTCRPGSPSNCP